MMMIKAIWNIKSGAFLRVNILKLYIFNIRLSTKNPNNTSNHLALYTSALAVIVP